MKSPVYWEGRQKKLWEQLEKDEGKLIEKLSRDYDRQVKSFEKEIALYYQKYGQNNVIEYRTLMQQLDADDKRLLIEKMEVFGEKYPEYRHLLPVRESIYRLNRLEGLQHSIYIQQLEIGGIDQETLEKHLVKEFERGYTAMAKELGLGSEFNSVNKDLLKKTINARWVGEKNFSERIWGNRTKLADYLNRDFAQAMARGDSYERCMRELKKRFSDVSRKDMYNLVYTEGTHIMNEASITPFEKDFSYYKYSPLMDKRTCNTCSSLMGKPFKIDERQPGTNFPPMHTRCRCSFTIVISDDFVDQYVAKHGSDGLQNSRKNDKIKAKKDDYNNFNEMRDYFKNKWDVNVDSSIEKLDFSAVKESAKGIVQVLKEFQQAQNTLKTISTKGSGVMCATINGGINFNPSYYDDIAKLSKMIQGSTTGFHPKNTGLLETGSHEMGHLLELALIQKNNEPWNIGGIIDSWNSSKEAKRIISEACKVAKRTPEGKGLKNAELVEGVSRYAVQNRSETLAECIGDYVANGDNAFVLSKEVWKILKRELG